MSDFAAMESSADMQAGAYGEALWFRIFVNLIERKFPGAGVVIEKLAALLPWAKLFAAVNNAIADWQAGKDFLTILMEAVKEWVEVTPTPDGPVRFSAKS